MQQIGTLLLWCVHSLVKESFSSLQSVGEFSGADPMALPVPTKTGLYHSIQPQTRTQTCQTREIPQVGSSREKLPEKGQAHTLVLPALHRLGNRHSCSTLTDI
jgi:hypothetical protein